jgi:hypothetical protein
MKPKLKPPGTKRLKLQFDEQLSSFGSKFKLRRFNTGSGMHDGNHTKKQCGDQEISGSGNKAMAATCDLGVRRCMFSTS